MEGSGCDSPGRMRGLNETVIPRLCQRLLKLKAVEEVLGREAYGHKEQRASPRRCPTHFDTHLSASFIGAGLLHAPCSLSLQLSQLARVKVQVGCRLVSAKRSQIETMKCQDTAGYHIPDSPCVSPAIKHTRCRIARGTAATY